MMHDIERDHGGDLERARRLWGGDDWIDLSTGINRAPWPVPELPPGVWRDLPQPGAAAQLIAAAGQAWSTSAAILPLAGAQAAIQLVPRLRTPGQARVLGPTYNEHAAALSAQGWAAETVPDLAALSGADLAIVVNPNNPDGRSHAPASLRRLAGSVGLLVVDESFVDPHPDLSLTPDPPANALVLRSFGKFHGLAGLRLGFAVGSAKLIARLRDLSGPWAVSGPALAIGAAALADRDWARATTIRLQADAARLDGLAARAGWTLVGGTALFRTYATADSQAAQATLARDRIWTRRFPYSGTWLRLGLPGTPQEWLRLTSSTPFA